MSIYSRSWKSGYLLLLMFLFVLISGCVTARDFGPRGDGVAPAYLLAKGLGISKDEIVYSHTAFLERDRRPGTNFRGAIPGAFVISTSTAYFLVWDQAQSRYQAIWARDINKIEKFFYESPMLAHGITIICSPDENGIRETVGMLVAEWTGFSDSDAAKRAEAAFKDITD